METPPTSTPPPPPPLLKKRKKRGSKFAKQMISPMIIITLVYKKWSESSNLIYIDMPSSQDYNINSFHKMSAFYLLYARVAYMCCISTCFCELLTGHKDRKISAQDVVYPFKVIHGRKSKAGFLKTSFIGDTTNPEL